MRVLSGTEALTSGSITFLDGRTTSRGGRVGVRMAFQETSLAPESDGGPQHTSVCRRSSRRVFWRRASINAIETRLREIFPARPIRGNDYVDALTLAERQMVEIARATLDPELNLLILDEPTESLDRNQAADLYRYVRDVSSRGLTVILISHRLREILAASDRVAVLKDGAVVSIHPAAEATERGLFGQWEAKRWRRARTIKQRSPRPWWL